MAREYDKRRPRLPVELAQRVDASRGQVSFNRWVVEALERALDVKAGPRSPLTDRERQAIEHGREGLDATPFADAVAKMPRARSLVGRDSAAMERQRRMNEAKGL